MARQIGYMRLSTSKEEQKFDRQEKQLLDAGIQPEDLYADRVSGSVRERPALDKMLDELQAGDVVYIVAIDRLSRSTSHLLSIVDTIKDKGAFLKSVNDTWLDTTEDNPLNEFLLTIMGALATMERKLIQQRIKEGVKIAQEKGTVFGRPTANKNKVDYAIELYIAGNHTGQQIADITGISRKTLYNKLKERGIK